MLRTLTIITCAVLLAATAGCRTKEYCTSHSQCDDHEICDSEHHCVPSACGDGIIYGGEACDDGNTTGGDGCSPDCQLEACGNGALDLGEQCDDGNTIGGDGCSANCLSDESCGNGTLDPGETCDDGNTTGGDGCSADCLSDESCGNGVTDTAVGETCDDANTEDGDGCSADCLSDETCGNGVTDTAAGETCDDGNTVDGDGCSADCLSDESCGNGVTDTAAGETCDDGNTVDWDGCMACTVVELQVNTYTTEEQTTTYNNYPVAMADDGRFVVVWSDAAQDGDEYGVFGQVYDTIGNPVGTELQVNTYTTKEQSYAVVAMANDGSFVVVWHSFNQVAVDSDFDIYGQRFDSTGSPVGGEFLVNTETTMYQHRPSIGIAANGSFVVVWESYGIGIFGQRFDSSGAPLGNEFQVNTCSTGIQEWPAVSMNDDGSFVVVWSGQGDGGDDEGVHGQVFHSTGVMIGTEFQVNVTTAGNQRYVAVASSGSNGFVIVWASDTGGVYGRRFDAGGSPLTSEFQVNTTTVGNQRLPSVANASDGAFTVVWLCTNSSVDGVYGQRFAAGGIPVGGEFQINSYTAGSQTSPAVAMSAGGRFIALWTSSAQDGDGNGIFAKRYDDQGSPIAVGR